MSAGDRAQPAVRQLRGAIEISEALRGGVEIGALLVEESAADAAIESAIALAREKGVPIRKVTAAVIRRMTSTGVASPLLALVGRIPRETLGQVLTRRGSLWLLIEVAYATNAGVAIRTAEGVGADAIAIDAPDFDHAARRSATRASMRADWYMPVFWERATVVLQAARDAGHAIYAVENSGSDAPWEVDLRGPALFIIGGESRGIPATVLAQCDRVLRIPMAGFIPSFNLQIALGVVGVERQRQLSARGRTPPQ
jgi:tRNA G18 (ribose-2'-O)-methylase SpoU